LPQALAAFAVRDRPSPTVTAIAEAALAHDAPEACRPLVEHDKRIADYPWLALEQAQRSPC
jgi:hypothetical protein